MFAAQLPNVEMEDGWRHPWGCWQSRAGSAAQAVKDTHCPAGSREKAQSGPSLSRGFI